MSSQRAPSPGWILLAGLVLVAVGLSHEGRASQDSGPVLPGPPSQGPATGILPPLPAFATADSNGSMIAVTGIDITGSSLLFLVDTERMALSVYQATGGTGSMNNVRWVGARKIALDMEVDGFNDRSEYQYKDLVEQFERNDERGGE